MHDTIATNTADSAITGQRRKGSFANKWIASLIILIAVAGGLWLFQKPASREDLQVGDSLQFGKYMTAADKSFQPLVWQVLRRDSDGILVMTKYGIDSQLYNDVLEDTTWEQCSLRRWLNDEFVNLAFDDQEQAQLMTVHLSNSNSSESSPSGGSDIDDRVFLLSSKEADVFFGDDEARKCEATPYLISINNEYKSGRCRYWLRSTGNLEISAYGVNLDGEIHDDYFVTFNSMAVRPVIKIAFNAPQDSSTITLGRYPQSSDGGVEPISWRVLRRDRDGLLAIAANGIDTRAFHEEWDDIDWPHCTLRQWLNDDFLPRAFNDDEQQRLLTVHCGDSTNVVAETSAGSGTDDRVVLLSATEAAIFFASPEERRCNISAYQIAQKVFNYQGHSNWWLRTPGMSAQHGAYVSSNGLVKDDMIVNSAGNCLVRPVIKVKL